MEAPMEIYLFCDADRRVKNEEIILQYWTWTAQQFIDLYKHWAKEE